MNPTRSSRVLIISGLIILFAASLMGVAWIYLANTNAVDPSGSQLIFETETALSAQVQQQKTEIAEKALQVESGTTTIDQLNATLASLTHQRDSALATQTAQKTISDLLAASLESYKATYEQDQASIAQIQSELTCDNTNYFKPDYTSNITLSKSLKYFISEIGGNFTYATWELLFPSSKNAIHRVIVHQDNRSFTNVFIVYFDETDFSTKGVFWINRACWLDK